jgi:quinoprotein glucose dehydrogenase
MSRLVRVLVVWPPRLRRRWPFVAAVVVLAGVTGLFGQSRPATNITADDWPTYGGDLASRRYRPYTQITAENFKDLEIAWRFKADALGPRPEFNFQATPLVIDGVLYTPFGTRRDVVALDAATGEMLWMHREDEGTRGDAAPRKLSGRGVAYWSDGRDNRVVYVTPGYQLVALDAKTGLRVESFGAKGVVDLKRDDDQIVDPEVGEIGLHATPIVAKDVIVVGAAHLPGGSPKSKVHEKGFIRGFDARTGKRLWTFHTIPEDGEFGRDTWEKDSATYTGNAGVWAQMTVDEELGLVYLPVEMPTGDYYGGHRPGAGLFGESLVALDIKTGKRRWHYQLVHHGIWDFDIPAAPILADITVDGRRIKAIAQPTKQNWLYVFNRETGEPVWPIEERRVPAGDVPGEWYSPTQPFVTKPPAYDLQGIAIDDLIDFTPALRAEAIKLVSRYKMGPLFTPPPASKWEGPLGLLMVPSSTGGANWPGGAIDPETNLVYVYSFRNPSVIGLVPGPKPQEFAYVNGTAPDPNAPPPAPAAAATPAPAGEAVGTNVTVQGLPLLKPPYGTISAIDLNRGTMAWQVAHGETPDAVRNNPALKGLNIPRTGRANGRIGVLVTKTLVIAGEPGFGTTPGGQRGAMLRAYDKATGAEAGAVYMPAPQTGSPMTYMLNGRQFLVVPISGANYSAELLAFALPRQN